MSKSNGGGPVYPIEGDGMFGGEAGAAAHDRLRANGLVPIYSLADKGWRSFKEDAVAEIR